MSREEHEYTFWTDVFGLDHRGQPIKVEGKEHYKRLMASSGNVPFEEAQKIAYSSRNTNDEDGYKTDPELEQLLREVRATSDKDGNVRLGSKVLDQMEKMGIGLGREVPEYLRNGPVKGGSYGE